MTHIVKTLSSHMRVMGICLGASTISAVSIDTSHSNFQVAKAHAMPHGGDPKNTLFTILNEFNLDGIDHIAVTGRRFHENINLSHIPEPQAVEYAYRFLKPQGIDCPAVVSAGGETFMAYVLTKNGDIANVFTGNKCASGTGEFFLQQLKRMNMSLSTIDASAASTHPYPVSGRCAVFCKSDCTHATNKGVSKNAVTHGLCVMMANKILELLKNVKQENIMITGGTTQNPVMTAILEKKIPGLIIPKEAAYFEATGAALWAFSNHSKPFPGLSRLIRKTQQHSFKTRPPLTQFKSLVTFKPMKTGRIAPGDSCILGLDVGSTTTKAVLIRQQDNTMVASVYLRTNGDPLGASRGCYRSILSQIEPMAPPATLHIKGLGVCGSGRQISGLHAMTDGIINEIIAHATAAVFFDPKVDTLFEIGGQDAKYTHITNGVPSDYAMNEACAAGTGSFLEESAYETLGIPFEDIAEIALQAHHPADFNDQCSAFIASDIKTAIHEGVNRQDIVAGLVYSVCMNYANRVKGNRPMGQRIFMQGGVCYNKAVPYAMAGLIEKPIIVPPEPGLMGAFGVALAVKNRMEKGIIKENRFDLHLLAARDATYKRPFICKGGKEKCDRKCTISVIRLNGRNYPFGGACNRYYNLHHHIRHDVSSLDLVKQRQVIVFKGQDTGNRPSHGNRPRIGINKSFLVNTYYPLYHTFFSELGLTPVLPQKPSIKGLDMKDAPFCYPAELAHGFFHSLITKEAPLDFIFLPHFKAMPNKTHESGSQVCPFVQGETFYLRQAFKGILTQLEQAGTTIITPLIDLSTGMEAALPPLVHAAKKMGVDEQQALHAFNIALDTHHRCATQIRHLGQQALKTLSNNPESIAVVIFGRSYNGFAEEAHMGIPAKLASRGVCVIPFDSLITSGTPSKRHMYWGMGQRILMAAHIVKQHPQLFGTYITNFSCGPDSFLLGYFRDIMGDKPSLTLELDSHTADAGIETRIEAYLDIVHAYRRRPSASPFIGTHTIFHPARIVTRKNTIDVVNSSQQAFPLSHPKVNLLVPSMGKLASEAVAAVLRSAGYRTISHPQADESILKLGQANTSCKECLPLILTTGTLLNYVENVKKDGDILVYFMPTASGPCRFGQYAVYLEDLIERRQLTDIALLSPTAENGYAGLGNKVLLRGWWGTVISDAMEDIRSLLLANAMDPHHAMNVFETEWQHIVIQLEKGVFTAIEAQIKDSLLALKRLPMKRPCQDVPTMLLTGEIFVRRDALSRRYLTEYLAGHGFAVTCSPVTEWMKYTDYLVDKGLSILSSQSHMEKIKFKIKSRLMDYYEKRLKTLINQSGLIHAELIDIQQIIDSGAPYISENLIGEAILTVGSALSEVASTVCGVIAIGPFGCMPNRLSEAILNQTMTRQCKRVGPSNKGDKRLKAILEDIHDLPFLAIESDGSPFPQLIHTKLEALMLRAERLHQKMIRPT